MLVDAPLGTAAQKRPSAVYRSTLTVGFPRESKFSLAWILRVDMVNFWQLDLFEGRKEGSVDIKESFLCSLSIY